MACHERKRANRFTDAFAVVGTDFGRRESFGRQKIGMCLLKLLHRGLVALPHAGVVAVVVGVTLWLSACPPTQGETWKRKTLLS